MEEKRFAKEITFEEGGVTTWVKQTPTIDLLYVSDYCGDHSENWIVQISKDGKTEYARFNTRFLVSIRWVDKV